MTAPYRTSEATLRAEVERLTREHDALRRRTRWTVTNAAAWGVAPVPTCGALVWSLAYIDDGWTAGVERGAQVLFVVALAWALCFVRRTREGL